MKNSIIIVLGNWMDKSGQLNKDSSSRADLAINIFRKNKHAIIVTCGWDYNSEFNTAIADEMKSYIVLNGNISHELVLTEPNSRDTVGDALFTKMNIVKKKNMNNLLVVTSDYHVLRTQEIFSYIYGEQYKINVIGSETTDKKNISKRENRSLNTFYETFKGIESGDDFLIYKRLCSDHPYYNGDFFPKIEALN
jgi:uncharacterized SAM-binding protein YcdF (DUF218 family)